MYRIIYCTGRYQLRSGSRGLLKIFGWVGTCCMTRYRNLSAAAPTLISPNINVGLTATYGCDGVICPLGTWSESGHASHAENGCRKCPEGETTMYLGSTICRPFSQEDILSILFDAMQGDRWPEELRENWKNRHIDVCFWSGVICDTKGDIVSIGFPIAWDDWANEGLG